MSYIFKLTRHCLWANQSWLDAISNNTSGDKYLRKMMSHILLSERAWFQRINTEQVDTEIWRVMPIEEMQDVHIRTYTRLLDDDLERLIIYRRFNGNEYTSPISDILFHLCTHGVYHRGQMTAHASQQSMAFPNTDFITFCRNYSV